jgi:ABC-type transport system involved in cytochrome c biogenesis permease subunit
MNDSHASTPPRNAPAAPLRQIVDWFASTQLAVLLLVGIAAVLAAATVLESAKGAEYSQWYVYKSPWFMALLGLLSLNILAATLRRFPWPRGKRGFLLAHVGVLVVLAGALVSFVGGIEGRLVIEEGQSADTLVMTDRNELAIVLHDQNLRSHSELTFLPEPADWPAGKTLRLKPVGGVQVEILKYYRHARPEERWVADPAPGAIPAIQLALTNADGVTMVRQWFAADALADAVALGPAKLTFQRAASATMLDDFLHPPSLDKTDKGVLSMHLEGQMHRIPVHANLGKKVALGKSDTRVEIVAYLPDAHPDAKAQFTTGSSRPDNPMLELKVYPAGKGQPVRQIAFAAKPFLNLDAIHGRNCPVQFWYHHPAVRPEAGVQFLQTPDGKLHYRVVADGKVLSHGEANEKSRIQVSSQLYLAIVKHLPHARPVADFFPVAVKGDDPDAPEAAVQVRVQAGGEPKDVWLQRGDSEYGSREIATSKGMMEIAFGYEQLRLGFSLKLVKFEHKMNPGMMGDASFASSVRVIDQARGVDRPAEIAMNRPLGYGGFTFYQSSYETQPDGKSISVLLAASDPGWLLKYLGCLMIGLGVFVVFYGKPLASLVGGKTSGGLSQFSSDENGTVPFGRPRPAMTTAVLACAMLAGTASASAAAPDATTFDWEAWRALPVQDGGREKPLDTLARETFRTISKRATFTDLQTHEPLDPVGLYLALLFTGSCWDRPTSAHATAGASACPGQPAGRQPDAWDREPLLLVDSSALRTALGLPADQKYISFLDLGKAQITDPRTDRKSPFIIWARTALHNGPRGKDALERKAADLADRYWAYQQLRRGQGLSILPVKDSKTQEWLSIARLMQAPWDDKTDPAGQIRTLSGQLQKARAAYLAKNPGDFHAASLGFLTTLREIGPQSGDYPSADIIGLEVAYNRLAPLRAAWACTLVALLGMLAGSALARRSIFRLGVACYAAGIAAVFVVFGLRMVIAARAPVTNMYESVVFVGLGAALFGLIFRLVYRKDYVLTGAAAVSTLALLLADTCFDPSIQPLTPVLRNNFWLVIHVMTIMLSYAAFALAWLIGNITLVFSLLRNANRATVAILTRLTYQFVQAGILLLIAGTFLGAWWADYSWGRFWGWDPKEVWALVTLLLYLALLHARLVGWVGDFGLAAFSVVCFASILMAWYGVNYVLATGLHSYGFGGGGQVYVLAALAVQFIGVGAATIAHASGLSSSGTSNRSRNEASP